VDNSKVFNRSGLASKLDIANPEWKKVFNHLERDQTLFASNEKYFRSEEYKWPKDPLHTWSRVWEYPYIYYHLERETLKVRRTHIVDLGSGVTFFPFSLARLGLNVTCTDIDPVCSADMHNAMKVIPNLFGTVDFRICTNKSLPFYTNGVSAVYCISVLEHVDSFEDTISEVERILEPDGLFLLTIGINIKGNREMQVESYRKLISRLEKGFDYLYPIKTVHPNDLLLSDAGLYPYHDTTARLAVEGMVLIKK